jgi:hypothetical protein
MTKDMKFNYVFKTALELVIKRTRAHNGSKHVLVQIQYFVLLFDLQPICAK